jgi:hypothetical protein
MLSSIKNKMRLTGAKPEDDIEDLVFADVEKPEVSFAAELGELDLPDWSDLKVVARRERVRL